jgi:hypothetical protein
LYDFVEKEFEKLSEGLSSIKMLQGAGGNRRGSAHMDGNRESSRRASIKPASTPVTNRRLSLFTGSKNSSAVTIKTEVSILGSHSQDTLTTKTPLTRDNKFCSKEKVFRATLQQLRKDLSILRQCYSEQGSLLDAQLHAIQESVDIFRQTMLGSPDLVRANLSAAKKKIEQKGQSLSQKIQELNDIVEELKLDVTQRKCKPTGTQFEYIMQEAMQMQMDLSTLRDFLDDIKPTWKQSWEQDLQRIVKEQEFLKSRQAFFDELDEEHQVLMEVFETVKQLADLQQMNRASSVNRIVSIQTFDGGPGGLSGVFQEIESIVPDSEKRLKRVDQFLKMRQREKEIQVDPFESELKGFVEFKKLKKTGGTAELDRMREKKDKEFFGTIFESDKK